MRRSDLIVWMSGQARQLSQEQIDERLRGMISEIRKTLLSEQRIEFRGLGSFRLRPRQACVIKHPKTGKPQAIPAGYRIHFKPAKALENQLNTIPTPESDTES